MQDTRVMQKRESRNLISVGDHVKKKASYMAVSVTKKGCAFIDSEQDFGVTLDRVW